MTRTRNDGRALTTRAVVLLTATIMPARNSDNLIIKDPTERLSQYIQGFSSALSMSRSVVRGVIFAENSGADLGVFAELASGREDVELLSYNSTGDGSEGRGYLETRLVIDAMRDSKILASQPTVIWKVTGRYRVRNLIRLMQRVPPSKDLYFNLRRWPYEWADMWVYGATLPGLALLEKTLEPLRQDRGQPAELALFKVLRNLEQSGEPISLRFPVEPRISGIRGFDGKSYDSPSQVAKWAIRSVARRVAGGLWI